jgi:hypothetical protein
MTSSWIRATIRLGCTSATFVAVVMSGAQGASATDPALPFSVNVSGSAVLTSPVAGTFSGSGIATHMGAITNVGTVEAHPEVPRDGCPNGFRSINRETFTAPNGDTLSLQSEDTACPVGPPGQFHGSGIWTVTGGTGRFAGATGGGPYHGDADFAAETFAFTFTGTITARP